MYYAKGMRKKLFWVLLLLAGLGFLVGFFCLLRLCHHWYFQGILETLALNLRPLWRLCFVLETLGYQDLLLLPKHFTSCLVGVSDVISEVQLSLCRVSQVDFGCWIKMAFILLLDKLKRWSALHFWSSGCFSLVL